MKSFNGSHPTVVSLAFFVVRPSFAIHVLAILMSIEAPFPRRTPLDNRILNYSRSYIIDVHRCSTGRIRWERPREDRMSVLVGSIGGKHGAVLSERIMIPRMRRRNKNEEMKTRENMETEVAETFVPSSTLCLCIRAIRPYVSLALSHFS